MTGRPATLAERIVAELGDPHAPMPAEVALARLKLLCRHLSVPVLVGLVTVLLRAWEFPTVAALVAVVGAVGCVKARPVRRRIIDSTVHGLWLVCTISLVGSGLLRWLGNPNGATFQRLFGVDAGPQAASILSEIVPVVIVVSMVLAVVYEVKMVFTEVRQVSVRDDSQRYMFGLQRTRRNAERSG